MRRKQASSKHRERLEKRIFRNYTNHFRDPPGIVTVSEKDYQAFLREYRKYGLPVFAEGGLIAVRPKRSK